MPRPIVTQLDSEKLLTDYLFALIEAEEISELDGWSVGTTVKPGQTPTNALRVRVVGGVDEQVVADRPRLDVRLWGDGSYLTEVTLKRAARKLLARLRRDFRCTIVANPVPLPDPADPTKTHVLFTVELLTRGVQS